MGARIKLNKIEKKNTKEQKLANNMIKGRRNKQKQKGERGKGNDKVSKTNNGTDLVKDSQSSLFGQRQGACSQFSSCVCSGRSGERGV